VRIKTSLLVIIPAAAMAALISPGCASTAGLFSQAFVNTVSGGSFPLTPGPGADFVMVRVINGTGAPAEFIVTIEREEFERDDNGNIIVDDQGVAVSRPLRETVRLNTQSNAPANDLGVLFPCDQSPINLIGLGENLLPNDPAVFIGGDGTGLVPGGGVRVGTLAPLTRLSDPSNFVCGDTVIFRAIIDNTSAGSVRLESFLLPGFEQPDQFIGPDTFVNYQDFLESQLREDE